MTCDQAKEYLLDYMDNELPATLQQELEEHLRSCASCRDELEDFRKTSLLLQLRAVPEPPPEYWEHAWSRIRTRTWARVLPLTTRRLFRHPNWQSTSPTGWRPRLAVAFLVLFAIAGLLWTTRSNSPSWTERRAAPVHSRSYSSATLHAEELPLELQRQVELITYTSAASAALDPISRSARFAKVEDIHP